MHCIPEWRPLIELNREALQIKRGELIFNEGDTVEGIYFILEGKVKVHKKWVGNKEYIVRLAKQGDILGHRGYGGDLVYPISATALEETSVCFVDNDFFFTTLQTNPALTLELMFFYAEELKSAERRMLNLAHMSVKGRIADALLMIQRAYGTDEEGTLRLSLTRKDMAALAGTTYETVIRTLNELIREQLVDVNGKEITLRDEAGLRTICEIES